MSVMVNIEKESISADSRRTLPHPVHHSLNEDMLKKE